MTTAVQKLYLLDTGVANNFFSGMWMLTRAMKQAGWVYKASSNGASKDVSGAASSDLWGGSGTPTADAYPTGFTGTAGPWWVASGPNILKIPIGAASTGTFQRNEAVTQASSGATGELLGYVWDATNAGWLIVSPRTGTFDMVHAITGAISAASATPTTLAGTVGAVFAMSGTVGVTNNSKTVPSTITQVGVVVVGSIIQFASQAGTNYTVNGVTSTTITLLTNYTGTTNAATTAKLPFVLSTSSSYVGVLGPGSIVQVAAQAGTNYTAVSVSATQVVLNAAYSGTANAATTLAVQLRTYTQEVCFWKSTADAQTGNTYWIMADAVTESASLFSTLASAAGCTAVIAPAGGGTANAFPAMAICLLGTGGAATGPAFWYSNSPATPHCLVAAVNATPGAGVSADGTSWILFSDTTSAVAMGCVGLFRLDDTEPGDVCPYEWLAPQSTIWSSWSRTTALAPWTPVWGTFTNSYVTWVGYVARGVGAVAGAAPDVASFHLTGFPVAGGTTPAHVCATSGPLAVQNHPAAAKPMSTDSLSLYCNVLNQAQAKGRVRWMRYVTLGSGYDTTDGKTWVAFLPNTSNANPAVYVGPWDGVTTPAP